MNESLNQTIGHYSGDKIEDYYKSVKNNTENEEGGVDANVFNFLKEVLPKNLKDKNTMDLGCGDGRWSKYLKSLGAENVLAIDSSADMLNKAKQAKQKIHLIQADLQKLPIKDNSIDLGLSTFSLMYFKDLSNILKEISRTLKENARLYIATNIINLNDAELLKKLKGKSVPVDLGLESKIRLENLVQTINDYKEAFEQAGLEIKTEEHFDPIGVAIPDDYKHKDKMKLEKVLWVLKKIN